MRPRYESEYYVFTGRSGMAVTLVTQFDIKLVHAIEEKISKSYHITC